jgi:hypothetical protein
MLRYAAIIDWATWEWGNGDANRTWKEPPTWEWEYWKGDMEISSLI